MIHWQSLVSFVVLFSGYSLLSTFLQLWFYWTKDVKRSKEWKIQTDKVENLGNHFLWLPLICRSKPRGPNHALYATLNLTMASIFAAIVTETYLRGMNRMHFEEPVMSSFLLSLFLSFAWQAVVEYYWHRTMHQPYLYKRLHKVHHFYKNPEPFDDLYIHPLEALGYYCILWSPPFLFHMHVTAFLIYIIAHGTTGVLDHSGIRFHLPGIYNTEDHDLHHLKFECNYAFPHPLMDILHGTYSGIFLGQKFMGKKSLSKNQLISGD